MLQLTRRRPPTDGGRTAPDLAQDGRSAPRLSRDPAVALAAVLTSVLVLHSWAWIGMPFGRTHEGRNGALWTLAGKALTSAPLQSGLGSEYRPGTVYAHHPPLIIALTAIGRMLGSGPFVSRLPAIASTAAALVLLVALMRALRCSTPAICAGLLVTASTPMFLTYGTMIDTPMVGLPFGIAVLLVTVRIRQGRPPPAPVVAATFGLAVMVSWQALAMALLACAVLVLDGRRTPRSNPAATQAVVSTIVAGALAFAWLAAASSSLSSLMSHGRTRSAGVLPSQWLETQVTMAADLWRPAPLVLGAVLGALALTDRRARPVLVCSAAVGIGWAVAFRQGAFLHNYWTYWALLPMALAVGCGTNRLVELVPVGRRRLTTVAILSGSTLVLLVGVSTTSAEEATVKGGAGAGLAIERYVRSDEFRADAPVVFRGEDWDSADWILMTGVEEVVPVDEVDELTAVLDRRSDAVAIIPLPVDPTAAAAMLDQALVRADNWVVVPASAYPLR